MDWTHNVPPRCPSPGGTTFQMRALIAIVPLVLLGSGCSQDSCKEYSRFTCEELEHQPYNVYYYDMDRNGGTSNELYLGSTIGLSQCGAMAWDAAAKKKKDRSDDWSYVCCLQTSDSACAEKHG